MPIFFFVSLRLFFIRFTSYICSFCCLHLFWISYFILNKSIPIFCYSRFLFSYKASILSDIFANSFFSFLFKLSFVLFDDPLSPDGHELLLGVKSFWIDLCNEELLFECNFDFILLIWIYWDEVILFNFIEI